MKRQGLFLLLLLLAAACIKTTLPEPREVEMKVTTEDATKTSLNGSGVLWSAGDKMMVYYSGSAAGKLFRLFSGEGTGSGTFLGEAPPASTDCFAVYPETATYNGSSRFFFVLPSSVPYTEGSFAPGTNPMLSSTKSNFDGSFSMKNLCGVMRLRLKGTIVVSSLELTFPSSVSGAGHCDRGQTTLIMDDSSDADKKVTMTMGSPVQLEEDGFQEFYFVLPPGSYSGFSIKAVLPNGNSAQKEVATAFSITRSQVTTLEGTLPAPALASRPELKVWSFNIACQKNDDNSSWGSSHYWSKRKDAVYAFFNTQNPDIIGTQECEYRQRVNILDNTTGYAAYGLGTEYGKESSGGSGSAWDKITGNYKDYNTDSSNAIFYKEDKFIVLDKGTFWLSTNPASVGSDDGHNCAWIKFCWKENGYVFYFFNTHFTAHYTDAAYAARKAEASILYDQIASINTENLPMVITADFNSTASEMCGSEKGDPRWSNYYWARNVDGKTDKSKYPTSYNNFKTTCTGFSTIYSSGTCTSGNSNLDSIVYGNFYSDSKHGLKAGSFGTDYQAYKGVTYISDHWPITATLVFDYQ